MAGALAGAGQYEQATALARSITDPYVQALALAQVAGALAGAGQYEQAEAGLTEGGFDHRPKAEKRARAPKGARLAQVAGALAGAGQYEQADGPGPFDHRPVRAGELGRWRRWQARGRWQGIGGP